MLNLRPVLGGMHRQGGAARIGDYFLHLVEPGMYRISNTDQDAELDRASSAEPWRISDSFPGSGAIVSSDGFFRIFG